jgi:preprotein translocase subunit YajC
MLASLGSMLILAEEKAASDQGSMWILMVPVLIALVLWQLLDPTRRRDQAKRDLMLKNMKKNDRVATIGGILGTVADISADGKEVTVKVADNTRVRFRRSAISEVLAEETSEPPKTP